MCVCVCARARACLYARTYAPSECTTDIAKVIAHACGHAQARAHARMHKKGTVHHLSAILPLEASELGRHCRCGARVGAVGSRQAHLAQPHTCTRARGGSLTERADSGEVLRLARAEPGLGQKRPRRAKADGAQTRCARSAAAGGARTSGEDGKSGSRRPWVWRWHAAACTGSTCAFRQPGHVQCAAEVLHCTFCKGCRGKFPRTAPRTRYTPEKEQRRAGGRRHRAAWRAGAGRPMA